MADIDIKYESWMNNLLDLGKRNRLLNYKDTVRSTVKVTYPDCGSLYESFVHKETSLIFPYENLEDENTSSTYVPNVGTNKNPSELKKALKYLRSKAKTSMEEQGINVLYLSFGFLNWTESENSNNVFAAPLILVPVTLTVKSITSPYFLNLHEDEIVLNPTLVYKLENDYGITLPHFDENEDVINYFNRIREDILHNNWSISEEVSLGLLSFLKINMYTDLKSHKLAIISNPIVRAISGDTTAISQIPGELVDYDFDKMESPNSVFQIVDADASQQEAILLAKKGISFVLQGPPGTGKSQTITNIIAESLADGKKVLFVSEKMAALDVVHRRLSSAGLDDFCLVLHSYKANKKSVLNQLGKVLELSQVRAFLPNDEVFQKFNNLQYCRKLLNDYAEQVYTKVEPLGKTIYEVNGIIANLESYDEYIFSIDNVRNISKNQYNEFINLISQFVSTIGKMTDDFKNNPWRNCKLTYVSNEFRHDITAHIHSILPQIKSLDTEVSDIFKQLYLDLPHTFSGINSLINILECVELAFIIPYEWIEETNLNNLFEDIKELKRKKAQISQLIDNLKPEFSKINISELLTDTSDLSERSKTLKDIEIINKYISSTQPYRLWADRTIEEIENTLSQAIKVSDKVLSLKAALLETYEQSVFDLDYESILGRFKTEYTSFTKVFKKEYKQDKKSIQFCHKDIVKKISDEEMLSLIEKLREIDNAKSWFVDNSSFVIELFGEELSENSDFTALKNSVEQYKTIRNMLSILNELTNVIKEVEDSSDIYNQKFKFLYNGIMTNWDNVEYSLKWALIFKDRISNIPVSTEFIKAVCAGGEFKKKCIDLNSRLNSLISDISQDYNWIVSNFNNNEEFSDLDFKLLYDRFDDCVNNLFMLEEWIDFRNAREKCIDKGLQEFIDIVETNIIPVNNILPIFKKRFFRLWLDAVLPEFPAILNFREKNQEIAIRDFSSLDMEQFAIARARIRGKLINDLPSLEHFTSGVDEISILKRELNKQRRIMPIRRLFKQIPNLLLTLKPCLMMSPLSVSLFLEAETYKFDMVIFDEASQVCTENAIGAISRAKQVIIAGDSRQLPPTNFFKTTNSESDYDFSEDEYEDTNAYDSVLDEAVLLPEKTLRWHYRSKHESLIAFSNANIYNNAMITFPSNIDKMKDNGVEYVYVENGFYDRGGKKGNVYEAKKVAELVFKHINEQPQRSLGVIAFGEVQQQAIESAIQEFRLQNQQYEDFFAEDKENAFFVKNLENVQGDERDTIILSIGYAKDVSGNFKMFFGPLSKSGGERRLNVAITRAKYNLKLVGSILPTDIDDSKINADGPKLLRKYIYFAISGGTCTIKDLNDNSMADEGNSFEDAVCRFLEKSGYEFERHLGCSGYKIDIAVKHPTIKDVYVLGIECDGFAYHTAKTARERDRLRRSVLNNMGWKIYHIWSAEWTKDCKTEENNLLNAIDTAIHTFSQEETVINKSETLDSNAAGFLNIEEKKAVIDEKNPYGFEPTSETDFSILPKNSNGLLNLTDCIKAVVNTEFPVHYDVLCQRLTPLFGNEKATVKVKRQVDYGLKLLKREISRKGDFIYPKQYLSVSARLPNTRKIQHISTEELSAAMITILKTCVGTTREALCAETTRVYGFNRAGQNISAAMNSAVDNLIESGCIEEIEGKLRIKQ